MIVFNNSKIIKQVFDEWEIGILVVLDFKTEELFYSTTSSFSSSNQILS